MFIIYNISGLIIGLASFLPACLIFVLTAIFAGPVNGLAVGLLAMAAFWAVAGVAWRNNRTSTGEKRPWPALFFIPLPFASIPLALLTLPLFVIALIAGARVPDSRETSFKANVKELDAFQKGGDTELSIALLEMLQPLAAEESDSSQVHVFTKIDGEAVLVLIKIPSLKEYTDSNRRKLLEIVNVFLSKQPETVGKQAFIGLKGKYAFGATQVPPSQVKIESVTLTTPLYDFYGPKIEQREAK